MIKRKKGKRKKPSPWQDLNLVSLCVWWCILILTTFPHILPHCHTHALTHNHIHSLAHTHVHSNAHIHIHSHRAIFSLPNPFTHSHTHTYTHIQHSLTHMHIHSLTYTPHTNTLSLTTTFKFVICLGMIF